MAYRLLALQRYYNPAADVEQLLAIAEMSNKYHLKSIQKWAVDALHTVLSGLHGPPTTTQFNLSCGSSAWMKQVLGVAILSGHSGLLNSVPNRWADRISARDLHHIHALETADRNGVRCPQVSAYFTQLLEVDDAFALGVMEDGNRFSRSVTTLRVAPMNGSGNDDLSASARQRPSRPSRRSDCSSGGGRSRSFGVRFGRALPSSIGKTGAQTIRGACSSGRNCGGT